MGGECNSATVSGRRLSQRCPSAVRAAARSTGRPMRNPRRASVTARAAADTAAECRDAPMSGGRTRQGRIFLLISGMAEIAAPEVRPGKVEAIEEKPARDREPGYLVICWNDPVNYMDYVTHVFQRVFG